MPIYAYKCEKCDFTKEVIQRIADAPLVKCPNCNEDSFKKDVTSASFVLKGTGWYNKG